MTQTHENPLLDVISAFLTDRKAQGLSKRTVKLYAYELECFSDFCQAQGVTALDGVTADTIRRYQVALEATRNEGGRHIAYRVIKTWLFWWERETDDAYRAPIRKVKPPKLPDEPQDPIERGDIDRLLDECGNDWIGQRDRAIILTLADTGVRASELCALDLTDLDIAQSCLTVRRGKGKKTRTVFFGQKTRRALRGWLRQRGSDSGALFTNDEGERLVFSCLRQIIRRRAKAAGIAEPGLHDFRRAACLAWLQAGVDVVTIARLLGHASTVLVWRYAKQRPQDLQAKYKSPMDGGE